jgi:ADP-dependent phosphofructokinase/glucokinase
MIPLTPTQRTAIAQLRLHMAAFNASVAHLSDEEIAEVIALFAKTSASMGVPATEVSKAIKAFGQALNAYLPTSQDFMPIN